MMVVPADTAVKRPVPEPIVATVVLLLLQLPPDVPSVSTVVAPVQIEEIPAIAAGVGFTVIDFVAMQPLPRS
jgi:hypothetical protein